MSRPMFESIVDQDRDEYRSAARHDPADYKRISGTLYDRHIVPSADEVDGWDEP